MTAKIHVQHALPNDEDLDRLDSGVPEVDAYFRSRAWFDVGKGRSSPATYQFKTTADGEVVGYAAAAFRKQPHPTDRSRDRARVLVIYVLALHAAFQGRANPRDPTRRYAATIMGWLESMARARAGCVGVSLWVRAENQRAIAFYARQGFCADPDGPVSRDAGSPHLTMRRLFDR